MGEGSVIVACSRCGAKNRVPKNRWGERAVCGKCKAAIELSRAFPDAPIEASDYSFSREVLDFPGPVLVGFHAPW